MKIARFFRQISVKKIFPFLFFIKTKREILPKIRTKPSLFTPKIGLKNTFAAKPANFL